MSIPLRTEERLTVPPLARLVPWLVLGMALLHLGYAAILPTALGDVLRGDLFTSFSADRGNPDVTWSTVSGLTLVVIGGLGLLASRKRPALVTTR